MPCSAKVRRHSQKRKTPRARKQQPRQSRRKASWKRCHSSFGDIMRSTRYFGHDYVSSVEWYDTLPAEVKVGEPVNSKRHLHRLIHLQEKIKSGYIFPNNYFENVKIGCRWYAAQQIKFMPGEPIMNNNLHTLSTQIEDTIKTNVIEWSSSAEEALKEGTFKAIQASIFPALINLESLEQFANLSLESISTSEKLQQLYNQK